MEQLHQLENFIGPSKLSTTVTMEGIIVKNAVKQMRGKLVRPEFMKQLEEDDHWLYKKLVKNQLAPGVNPYAKTKIKSLDPDVGLSVRNAKIL